MENDRYGVSYVAETNPLTMRRAVTTRMPVSWKEESTRVWRRKRIGNGPESRFMKASLTEDVVDKW